jgi:hypothetical protein
VKSVTSFVIPGISNIFSLIGISLFVHQKRRFIRS